MPQTHAPTIRARFAFTLGANLFKSLLSFATGLITARGLGPEAYGSMAFLLGTCISMRQLLDMGSSTAFFTFLSQRSRSRHFVAYYMYWLAGQFLLVLTVIGLLFPDVWLNIVWKGEQRSVVVLAFVAAFLQSNLWPTVVQMGESQRLTRWVQAIGVGVVLMHLVVVAVLWFFSQLGLYLIFGAIAIEYLAASWFASTKLHFEPKAPREETIVTVFREYARYCLPLIVYSWVGFAYDFADRWLLQNYGGSIQQAYYSVGAQFASIALIATTSVMNVFWKEIAEAYHRGDGQRVATLYRRVSRILYMGGATVAGFLIPWAEDILHLLLGPRYVGGAAALAIMFLYPVHQSMGQIGGAMLYATGRVRVQVTLGIGFMLASIVVSYFVLASPGAFVPGLGLASTGLAIKVVAMQFLQVNVIAILIAKGLGLIFDWHHQIVGLGIAVVGGWGGYVLSSALVGHYWSTPATMAVAGLIYSGFILAALYALPWLVDMPRFSLANLLSKR